MNMDSALYDTCDRGVERERRWIRKYIHLTFYIKVFNVPDTFPGIDLTVDDLNDDWPALRDTLRALDERFGPVIFHISNPRASAQYLKIALGRYARRDSVEALLWAPPHLRVHTWPDFLLPASAPNDRGLRPRTPWDSIIFSGSNPFWPRTLLRLGWLWNLWRQNLPLAWEITRGRPSIAIAIYDTFTDSSAHPEMTGARVIDESIKGDGDVTLRLGFGHGLMTMSGAIAKGDNDTARGRSMIGTCPECAGIALADLEPECVDLDGVANNVFEHVAVWSYSIATGDLTLAGQSLREDIATRLEQTFGAGIVGVVAAGNDMELNDGRSFDSTIGGSTVRYYRATAGIMGALTLMDSSDPTRDVKAIAVGATVDGMLRNVLCEAWEDSTQCHGGPNYDGQAEIFQPRYTYSSGRGKFDDTADGAARQERKGRAFMDLMAATATMVAIDGAETSDSHAHKFMPNATGTSHAAPQVAGVAGLMLSVNRYLGVTVSRDSCGRVWNAHEVQRRARAILTFTADKLADAGTVDSGTHYVLQKTGCQTIIVDGRCVDSCAVPIDTVEVYRYSRVNDDGSAIQYGYLRQTKDPMGRSWAQRMGFGRMNAYRAVAHAIPLKGDYSYASSTTLSIADTTSMNENRMRLIHFGAWRDSLVRVLDSGGVAVPGGDTTHRNMGVTMINGTGTTITVPDSLILAIDGIVTTDNPTGGNAIVSTDGGKVLLWGYLEDVEVIGATRLGDLTIVGSDTNTVGCVAVGETWIDAEQYGTVTLKEHGVYLINRGRMTLYPGRRSR